jgi:hypothetical protein
VDDITSIQKGAMKKLDSLEATLRILQDIRQVPPLLVSLHRKTNQGFNFHQSVAIADGVQNTLSEMRFSRKLYLWLLATIWLSLGIVTVLVYLYPGIEKKLIISIMGVVTGLSTILIACFEINWLQRLEFQGQLWRSVSVDLYSFCSESKRLVTKLGFGSMDELKMVLNDERELSIKARALINAALEQMKEPRFKFSTLRDNDFKELVQLSGQFALIKKGEFDSAYTAVVANHQP